MTIVKYIRDKYKCDYPSKVTECAQHQAISKRVTNVCICVVFIHT